MSQLPESIAELIANNKELDIEQKIVEELLNTDKNLVTKTELQKPIKFTLLKVISEMLKDKELKLSYTHLERFMELAFKYLISKDRKGRLEYIQALQSIRENQKEKIDQNPMSMEVRK